MSKERIEQIARECGLLQDIWVGMLGGSSPCVTIPDNLSPEQFKFARALRNEALEDAARECEKQYAEPECHERALYCAAAIRRMKL